MRKENLFLSSITENCYDYAHLYGVGVEIADFCTASNMDAPFPMIDKAISQNLKPDAMVTMHGPFNELFPCAIDPKARDLAAERYHQAILIAQKYGAQKLILHGGYLPNVYYSSWYIEQSILFWKEFLNAFSPAINIVLENVLESHPEWMLQIVNTVNDTRLGLCLDIGHANVYSDYSPEQWIHICHNKISHFHIHNNYGVADTHGSILDGNIDIYRCLKMASELCPDATYTLEIPKLSNSIEWLISQNVLEV